MSFKEYLIQRYRPVMPQFGLFLFQFLVCFRLIDLLQCIRDGYIEVLGIHFCHFADLSGQQQVKILLGYFSLVHFTISFASVHLTQLRARSVCRSIFSRWGYWMRFPQASIVDFGCGARRNYLQGIPLFCALQKGQMLPLRLIYARAYIFQRRMR